MGVARTVYIRRVVSCVLSSSSLHATSCILFGISTLLPFPPFPLIPLFRRRSSDTAHLSDTSVQHCPSLCSTRASDAVRLPVRYVHLTLSVSVDMSVSRGPFLFPLPLETSVEVPIPVPIPVPVPVPVPVPLPLPLLRRHSNSLQYFGEPPPLQVDPTHY